MLMMMRNILLSSAQKHFNNRHEALQGILNTFKKMLLVDSLFMLMSFSDDDPNANQN